LLEIKMIKREIKIPGSKDRSYKVEIGTGILEGLWQRIEADFCKHSKFVVTDENLVSTGHLNALLNGVSPPAFVISPAGETSKNINTVVSIIETMEKACLGRDSVIVALGGGTVGDIAGFAASIFKRGVTVIQIPTTTVAQADSAIGGKTGVDSSVSKNAFGAFWHPAAAYIDVTVLKTLDDRQFMAGLIESVKHALIADSEYFDFLEKNLDAIIQRNYDILEQVADYNCKIKGSVVEADPNEQNQRRILNYGHTIGHAVETASRFELLHGEAVAIGIMAAGLIEIDLGLAQPGRLERIREILEKLGLPVKLPPKLADKKLIEIIKHDKKAINKWPKFVLLSNIGRIYCPNGQWAVDVNQEVVEKALDKLCRID
jgi:3-dehydroquinate synthase